MIICVVCAGLLHAPQVSQHSTSFLEGSRRRPGDAQRLAKVLFLLRGSVHGGENRTSASLSTDAVQRQEKVEVDFISVSVFLSLQNNTIRGCKQSVLSGPIFATAEVWRSHGQVFRKERPGCCQRGQLLRFCSPLVRVFFKTAILSTEAHDPGRTPRSVSKNRNKVNAHFPPQNEDVPTQNHERKQGSVTGHQRAP